MNLLLHKVKHTRVEHTRLADTFYLFRRLDEFALGHQMPLVLKVQNPLVHLSEWLPTLHMPVSRIFLQQSHCLSSIIVQRYGRIRN